MKKHYIVRYDNDTNRGVHATLAEANTAADAMARQAPGVNVMVYQVKSARKVDTAVVVDVPLVD